MADLGAEPVERMAEATTIRRAVIKDVHAMAAIINRFAAKGEMLPRSHHQLYQFVRDFVVVTAGDVVVGCGALNIVWEDIGEIRSLAISEEWQDKGLGRRLVEVLLEDARALGLPKVFSLTYKQGFFEHMGFRVVPHESLPHKIWAGCLNCPKFPNCDEIAVLLELD